MTPTARLVTALLLLSLGRPLTGSSQVTPLTVPKGALRLDFSGEFKSWDWRWRDGSREEWAADLGRPTLDRAFLPEILASEERLQRVTGVAAVNLSIGRSIASSLVNLGTFGLGGAFGLTKSITLFGTVPIVAVKVEPRFLIDSTGANAAFGLDPSAQGAFFGQLAQARQQLRTRLTAGDFDNDPTLKALAQSTVAKAELLEAELGALLLTGSATTTVVPRANSTVAQQVVQVVRDLQAVLAQSFAITSFQAIPAFPSSPITTAAFGDYVTDPLGRIAALPLDDTPTFSYLGDIEVGATIALVDRLPTSTIGSGFRAYATAMARLRTAKLDSPNRFMDVGSGDRQPDVEMSLTADWVRGRLGARVSGGYNLQLPGNQNRRIAPPDQPIAPAASLAAVRRDPGDVIMVSARPFLRIATYLSVFGGVDFWTKQRDKFSYAADQPALPGYDPDVLAAGSQSDALLLSGGLSYSHSGLNKRGLLRLPMDASFRYQRIVRSGSGIVPDANTVSIDLRFYTRLFGKAPTPKP